MYISITDLSTFDYAFIILLGVSTCIIFVNMLIYGWRARAWYKHQKENAQKGSQSVDRADDSRAELPRGWTPSYHTREPCQLEALKRHIDKTIREKANKTKFSCKNGCSGGLSCRTHGALAVEFCLSQFEPGDPYPRLIQFLREKGISPVQDSKFWLWINEFPQYERLVRFPLPPDSTNAAAIFRDLLFGVFKMREDEEIVFIHDSDRQNYFAGIGSESIAPWVQKESVDLAALSRPIAKHFACEQGLTRFFNDHFEAYLVHACGDSPSILLTLCQSDAWLTYFRLKRFLQKRDILLTCNTLSWEWANGSLQFHREISFTVPTSVVEVAALCHEMLSEVFSMKKDDALRFDHDWERREYLAERERIATTRLSES